LGYIKKGQLFTDLGPFFIVFSYFKSSMSLVL
jgi:hypothetical protein